jgi:AraC-like DNA-binding protein
LVGRLPRPAKPKKDEHEKNVSCAAMGIPIEILLLTSGVGALQSAFFGIYLFTLKKGRNIANVLLALLLLAFTIRIIKSVSYYFSEGHTIPDLLMNLGFGTNLAILPLLWLYLNAFLKKDYAFKWWRDIPHLFPSLLAILLSPVLTSYFWMGQHGYTISLLSVAAYLPFCIYVIQKNFKKINTPQQVWVLSLTIGVTIVWTGYIANFMLGLVSYITAPVLFSFVVYFMSYLGLKQSDIFTHEAKYLGSSYSATQINQCLEDLQQLLAIRKLFKDTSLTLPRLANELKVSPNLLSVTINKQTGLNFPDFINSYRIKEAQALLSNPEHSQQKIATIAYETGFNSLSVFNAAFKKFTSFTPSAYRARALKG